MRHCERVTQRPVLQNKESVAFLEMLIVAESGRPLDPTVPPGDARYYMNIFAASTHVPLEHFFLRATRETQRWLSFPTSHECASVAAEEVPSTF